MLSLDNVTADCGSALILDASCARVQVGLVAAGREPAWIATDDEAGIGLFRASSAILAAAGMKPTSLGAFVFCDGPGSQLGIRTAAMAIRTWNALRAVPAPIFGYRSLQLAAHGLISDSVESPFAVVCDARRESWFVTGVADDGAVGPVVRLPAGDVAALGLPLHEPMGFRRWAEPPAPVTECDYTCADLFAGLAAIPLLQRMDDAEPWNPSPMEYKTWSGERHRAPPPHGKA